MLRVVVGAEIWSPFLELVPAHAVIPIPASACMSEKVFMPWAATVKALWGKSCISGSLEHLTGLTALWRRQDFAQVVILCRIAPRPVVPAASSSHNHCFSRRGRQRQCCYSDVTQGDNCLEHLDNFLNSDQKTVAALGDRLRSMPWELLGAERQTFPSDCCCALVPTWWLGQMHYVTKYELSLIKRMLYQPHKCQHDSLIATTY